MIAPLWGTASAGALTAAGGCQEVQLAVALAPGAQPDETLAGTLCTPSQWAGPQPTVDVLTSGATYDQAYWDWPVDPAEYSYVNRTLAAGRATFAYDRVGTGASSHPLSTRVTFAADAFELHQVVLWLRAQGYTQVDSIGHSLGSAIAIQEAAEYNDVDRLVITSLVHEANLGWVNLSAFSYPADLDPQFAGDGLDAGYLTTVPGSRQVFYSSSADPAVVSYDEQHKDTVTDTEIAGASAQLGVPPPWNAADQVQVPVLLVIGQQDRLLCGGPEPDCTNPASVQAWEAPYFQRAASLSVAAIPQTGHDVALHPSADQSFTAINQWLETH